MNKAISVSWINIYEVLNRKYAGRVNIHDYSEISGNNSICIGVLKTKIDIEGSIPENLFLETSLVSNNYVIYGYTARNKTYLPNLKRIGFELPKFLSPNELVSCKIYKEIAVLANEFLKDYKQVDIDFAFDNNHLFSDFFLKQFIYDNI